MGRLGAFVLVFLLISNVSFAGPLRDAVTRAPLPQQAQQTQHTNKLLYPGLAVMSGGAVLALYGFMHTTGAEVNIGTNNTGTSANITAKEKHNTGLGLAGLGIAGAGVYMIMKGARDASRATKRVEVTTNSVVCRLRF